ncbi:hypothetical protein C8R47DRAFT_1076788 [Mycena vitilis]|nr:hypothetical protein C8R47DRAFT_1076788 [Mycena vitilis]
MADLPLPAATLSLFTKRRRAFVACAGCRKRKIKCVKLSDIDNAPCTRCALKGIKCEYGAVTDDSSASQPSVTPPRIDIDLPTRERTYSDAGWVPPPITPPSGGYLDPRPAGRRHTLPDTASIGTARHPYQPRISHISRSRSSHAAEQPPRPRSASALSWDYPVQPLEVASTRRQSFGAAAPVPPYLPLERDPLYLLASTASDANFDPGQPSAPTAPAQTRYWRASVRPARASAVPTSTSTE